MWINPPSNLNGWQPDGERQKRAPGDAHYLKLADVALRPRRYVGCGTRQRARSEGRVLFSAATDKDLLFHVHPIGVAIFYARLIFRTVLQLHDRVNFPVVVSF
jgi:hypothetical protein